MGRAGAELGKEMIKREMMRREKKRQTHSHAGARDRERKEFVLDIG